ncbi:MAG: VacJ family lipoprotein [Methylococcales bacterium]|nr:VacJ family lipoprotein [Methylococcales bacterium]
MPRTYLPILLLTVLSGCATTQNPDDPYEDFNRAMYDFNQGVDDYVAEPVTSAYQWVTPDFMQTGVSNFFNNLKGLNTVVNSVLQGKWQNSASATGRLAVNSVIGLGGLFDVATPMGLEVDEEDFDQTLGVWGIDTGDYLVLPLFGPTTTRGIPGTVFDTAMNPATYIGVIPLQVMQVIDARHQADGALNFVNEAALDPYIFTREAYLQWRDNLVRDGQAPPAEHTLDLYDEALFEEDFQD